MSPYSGHGASDGVFYQYIILQGCSNEVQTEEEGLGGEFGEEI